MNICPACNAEIKYSLQHINVCRECIKEGYISAYQSYKMMGMNSTSFRNYAKAKDYGAVPKPAIIVSGRVAMWIKEDVEQFILNLPKLEAEIIDSMSDSGMSRDTIAKELKIHKAHLNLFCRRNNLHSSLVRGFLEKRDTHNNKFDTAFKLLNKSINITITP